MKTIIPIAILALSLVIGGTIIMTKKEPPKTESAQAIPKVVGFKVQASSTQLKIKSQGTVNPETQTDLFAEVSGRVIWISNDFKSGQRFRKGDVLVKIEPIRYQLELAQAEASLAQAKLALEQEVAASEQAQEDWDSLDTPLPPNQLVLRKPQLIVAKTNVKAAEANVALAKSNLDKTVVRAPYNSVIISREVDLGQLVSVGSSLIGKVHNIELAEVRLSLNAKEAQFLNLEDQTPKVLIYTESGHSRDEWIGKIERIEATIDPRSRLLYAVAVIPNAFDPTKQKYPLRSGQFVQAEIAGDKVDHTFVIPRSAIKDREFVYLITDENTLSKNKVNILKTQGDEAVITGGLEDGDRICMTSLLYFVDGMKVEVEEISK